MLMLDGKLQTVNSVYAVHAILKQLTNQPWGHLNSRLIAVDTKNNVGTMAEAGEDGPSEPIGLTRGAQIKR
jgi:hypothetical protein